MFEPGRKIYRLRLQRRITQGELARRSGIPQANLSNIETGKRDFTVSTLLRLCPALEVTPAEFFKEEPKPRRIPLTRAFMKRMVDAILTSSDKLSAEEKEIADRVRIQIPGLSPRRLSNKKVYDAWYELKSRLSKEEIQMLVDRVREEQRRREARAEKNYQKLVSKLRKLWKK